MVTIDEFTFVMDKELYQQASPVKVDISYMGFVVESNLQLGGGSCSTGGCGTDSSGCGTSGSCCS